MDSKNGTENNQKKENSELPENSKDKTDTSVSTENTEQNNSVPKPDLNKDNLENKEIKAPNNLDSTQKINENEKIEQNSAENEKNEEFTKQIELMKEYKKNNYKKFYLKHLFCDFRTNEGSKWKMGLITEVTDDFVIVSGTERKKTPKQIKIDDNEKITYFRKYSIPSEDNYYNERESKESLMKRLEFLENLVKNNSLINNEEDAWKIYYCLHSKIFFGLDAAMKINDGYNDDNEGAEESARIILCILLFISNYFKYILDNKDDFINYQNNIVKNKDLMDLKIINKKYAFFSFLEESLNLLMKIFAYSENYLLWFQCFENELKEFIPSNQDVEISKYLDYFPIYENQISEEEKSKENEKENKIILKKICLDQAYKFVTTYTTSNIRIRASTVAYFIDNFNAYNGFKYLFQICTCNKLIDIATLIKFLSAFNYAKAMTSSYAKSFIEEKKQLLEFAYSYIENLTEDEIDKYEYEDILNFIQKISDISKKQKDEYQKILENLYFSYYSRILITSKKLEQKINALNEINNILKSINSGNNYYRTYNKTIKIKEMTYEDFCLICKKNNILNILLSDKNIHEEIIKKLNKIIFVMYKFNFGYDVNQDKEKIESDKKLVFKSLFDKLLESEQTNGKLTKTIQNILSEFCEFLSEEDKLYVYGEIKKYLEKSITKKGIPVKDHLLFVIDFSIQAISTKKCNNKNKEKNDEKEKEIEGEEKKTKTDEDEEKEKGNEGLSNIKLEEGDYFGLNLLMNYLTEEEYNKYNMTNEQKLELINESIDGIIKIMNILEQKEYLLKYMILRTRNAITSSKDVIQFLILFEKIKKTKEINSVFNKILDEYSKKVNLLALLMTDMEKYLSIVNKDDSSNNNKKVYNGLFNNELNIKLRLQLIFDLIQKNIKEEDLENFKQKIINSCEKNKFANECLSKYLQKNFKNLDFKFIQYFYDNILLSKEKISNFNDLQYYKLCTEIIKEINKTNKIFYFMNNKDLAVLNCEYEKEIKGIELLWNFLINTETKEIRNDVTDFLADIFFGIKIKGKEKLNNYWTNFVKTIYDKLDEIIKKEKEEELGESKISKKKNDQSINGIISLIKKIENKFTNEGDVINNISKILEEISLNKFEQINKFEKEKKNEKFDDKNKKIFFSGKKYNSEDYLNFDMKIESTDYFYMLRYKLSSFFKIPVNLIKVVVDENKYDPKMKEQLKKIEFNMYDDFENTYSLLDDLEQKIFKGDDDIENHILIFRVEYVKENEKLSYIKKLIKDFPKLIELLKRKNSEYLLDVWCLIKEDGNNKINPKISQIIKDILNEEKKEQLNSIFNFQDTNIYYISYILFHLFNVIKELKGDDTFIKEKFLKSPIWQEKIKSIKLENNAQPKIGEIHEKNNIINYLLSIYKIISQKTNDTNALLFILNKLFEYYYEIINECISINLKSLPSTEGFPVDLVEDLYISNTNLIKEIVINNKMIYDNLINILLSESIPDKENNIKNQFEFLFREGILKNRIYTINQKLHSFLITIADDNFFNQNKDMLKKFYLYLTNFFFSQNSYEKVINCIKSIALDRSMDMCISIEKYENNIKLYFDIINNIIDKVFSFINLNFKKYINEIIIKQILNPIIDGIPLDYSYHEILLGGHCKTLINLLSKVSNYKELLNLNYDEEKKLKQYLFDEIIMNKCNKNIFTEKNIDNYRAISISTSYTFKAATNLFIFLLMQNIHNEDPTSINNYFSKLTELHNQCFWKGENISDWKLEFKENNRLTPYVGLKNLGCTCYMNSLLQIFFNYIPFRESLLKCKCKGEKKNSLYQIKKVFYSLKYLQVNYYTPSDFPKNYDDEELNTHQQMDIDEFFGNILDKIENRLKGTNNENLVKYFFQGRQNDTLTFQEGCTHHRTNTNNFYSIQLQIQDKKNIYESLDMLTEGELMNGDNKIFCPKCNKKIAAVKSQNFKTLPRMLIFVLKRFEFNYNTMKKVKINDYYEFPFELDMTKYISEPKKDTELNKYTLKSVVVHMGNCEGGHYYAFIKNDGEQWYEFNDTQVIPSNIEALKEEAFGGEETFNNNGYKHKTEKNKSAYLLFYEKKIQTDCEKFDNIEAINSLNEQKDENNEKKDNIKQENEDENKITIKDLKEVGGNLIIEDLNENQNLMSDIFDNINKEMFKYFLNKKLFSNDYQYFILELYLNVLNYFYSYDLPVFLMHLCRNENKKEELREIQATSSNINLYLNKNKLTLFCPKNTTKEKVKPNEEQILNIFKHFIQYFYNVMLRTKEKEFLGPMVDLIKFLIRDQQACANYLIEEFCNRNLIVEYLMNCPLYEIKKLIVGILYCAMIKSVNDYELASLKEENSKNKKNKKKNNEKTIASVSTDEDEELARQLQQGNLNGNYIFDNPLEYQGIPKNILKLIYNMLHLIRSTGYEHMNEQRFLYFTIYRFSLISQNTREFLVNKCRVFELLCLLLHRSFATYSYPTKEIIQSTNIGPYTVTHEILHTKEKGDVNIIVDKGGNYHIENYVYMLYFYLLSYTPKKFIGKVDEGYSLENGKFVGVLLNNIRTKQDAFCFSNYINEKCKNNKTRINTVLEALMEYLNKVDNNENTNYDFNNYNNFVNNDMNLNPLDNDPGMNPKYLLIIIKNFLLYANLKSEFILKGVRSIFKVFLNNQNYYNFCIMIIDYITELFSTYLKGLTSSCKRDLDQMRTWLERNPISPSLYPINGIFLYKYEKKSYYNVSKEKVKEFEEKEIMNTQNRIDKLTSILKNEPIKNKIYEKDIDLSDFKFMIGDVIVYDGQESVIEEALDELLKITIDVNKKNGKKKGGAIDRKEIWIETDDPKIEIKELKGK